MDKPERKLEFQHYKSGMYVLDAIAVHESTGENMAVYHSWAQPQIVYVRPAAEFFANVEVDGHTVPRFRQKDI